LQAVKRTVPVWSPTRARGGLVEDGLGGEDARGEFLAVLLRLGLVYGGEDGLRQLHGPGGRAAGRGLVLLLTCGASAGARRIEVGGSR